jgi:hypothetical protein
MLKKIIFCFNGFYLDALLILSVYLIIFSSQISRSSKNEIDIWTFVV